MASHLLESVYGNLSTILGSHNISDAIAHVTKAVEGLIAGSASQPSSLPEDTSAFERVTEFFYQRNALENTSLFLALTTFLVLAMSWTSRLGNLGRFSPFTRSPPQGSTKVSDADFSYITADDLRRHQAESANTQQNSADSPVDLGPPRDTDMLIIRNKKQEYTVHFPAYSIAKSELTVGQVREQAAKKVGTGDARRIKLLYKGKNLKDDSRTCKQENLRDGAELMCTVADRAPSPSESDSDEDFDGVDDGRDGEPKRRRNRGKKTKRRNKREERDTTASAASGEPNLGVPNSSEQTSRTQSPKPPSPATPLDKLNALHAKLQTFVPEVRAFQNNPPAEPAKKEFEHKRLSETILTQVLLKLDAVETDGDADARSRRKQLVQETQKVLQELDAGMKS